MSNKKVCILFNSKEETIEIDLNEIKTYSLFLQKIQELIKENDPTKTYQFMGINTSEQYLILNDDNYTSIMNENIPNDDLKLFLTKLEKIPETSPATITTTTNNGVIKSIIIDNNAEDDDDEDFKIEKEEEKTNNEESENKINSNITESTNENNSNNNINNINEVEKKDTENENNDNLTNYNMSYTADFDKIKNYTPLSTLSLTNNDNSNKSYNILSETNLTNMDTFSSETCSICGNQLFAIKYICCLCENAILCPQCESLHLHPCIKYKTQFLSNIIDIYKFMKQFYSFKVNNSPKNPLSKLFQKEYEIRISPMTDKAFSIRVNKDVIIPIKIRNLSKDNIYSDDFEVVARNNKEINISYESDKKFSIDAGAEYILKMICYAPSKNCEENINFCLFTKELTMKNTHDLNFDLFIEVNDDEEEEKLDKKIGNNDCILYSKQHKYDALEIMNELQMRDNPKEVFRVLMNHKWNKDSAKKILKKK